MTNLMFELRWIAGLTAATLLGCAPNAGGDPSGGAPARRHTPEHAAGPTNPLPFDNGVVPLERGKDMRPGVSAPPMPPDLSAATGPASTLVLYDETGPYGWLGELYGIGVANLASRFGAWSAKPVSQYLAGDAFHHTAVVYVGSTYDEPLPVAFLDDVLVGQTPVVWLYDNIWQLANRAQNFAGVYGFDPWYFDVSEVAGVEYKGQTLTRYAPNGAGIMNYSVVDETRATVLARAVRSDGTSFPWAVRSQNLTYLGEIPLAYISERDRYLAFCDLLHDALAPETPEQHRALVRIEDVNATDEPQKLRAIADALADRGVPFAVAVIAVYTDPNGAYSDDGQPETVSLADAPEVVAALRYMEQKGGTLLMHGYTHQYENALNPYTGASADDFEFWLSHIDADDYVIYDGPVPQDSAPWAVGRVDEAFLVWRAVGLPKPGIFEYPHYAGSAADSRAIRELFPTAYHRGLYFGGGLSGAGDDYAHLFGQFFPYVVEDVYGWRILPENLGSYEPVEFNHHPPRLPADIIAAASSNLVVRDGFASFYFHPYYPLSVLQQLVTGVKADGYTFVSASSL